MGTSILKKTLLAGIGAIEFSREKLSGIPDTVKDSLDELVERGERLNDREDSLVGALLAALEIKARIPTADEVDDIIPDYDDLKVNEIVDLLKSLPMKQLETIKAYEFHNYNRLRILRQIDRELDEVRIIPDYDSLAVGEVVERLEDLSPQQLAALRDYEKTHRKRTTILKAIEHGLASPA